METWNKSTKCQLISLSSSLQLSAARSPLYVVYNSSLSSKQLLISLKGGITNLLFSIKTFPPHSRPLITTKRFYYARQKVWATLEDKVQLKWEVFQKKKLCSPSQASTPNTHKLASVWSLSPAKKPWSKSLSVWKNNIIFHNSFTYYEKYIIFQHHRNIKTIYKYTNTMIIQNYSNITSHHHAVTVDQHHLLQELLSGEDIKAWW